MIGLKKLPKDAYIKFAGFEYDDKRRIAKVTENYEFLKDLIKDFLRNSKDVASDCKNMGIPRALPYKILKWKRKIRLEYLLKICNYLQRKEVSKYTVEFLENNIYSISSNIGGEIIPYIKKADYLERRFPFDIESKEAIICLTFPIGDGYIHRDYENHVRLGYTNSNIDLHEKVIRCVCDTFGQVSYSRRPIAGGYETFFTGILGKIYVDSLGFICGNKLRHDFGLPKILLDLCKNKEFVGPFISQLIDDEGSFGLGGLYITMSAGDKSASKSKHKNISKDNLDPPAVLKQTKSILNKIGIDAKFRKPSQNFDRGKNVWKLIHNLNVVNLDDLLTLYLILDIKRLPLKNKIHTRLKFYSKIIRILYEIEDGVGHFTIGDIAERLNVSQVSAKNYYQTLKRANFVKLVKRHYYLHENGGHKFVPSGYKLTIPSDLKELLLSF